MFEGNFDSRNLNGKGILFGMIEEIILNFQ